MNAYASGSDFFADLYEKFVIVFCKPADNLRLLSEEAKLRFLEEMVRVKCGLSSVDSDVNNQAEFSSIRLGYHLVYHAFAKVSRRFGGQVNTAKLMFHSQTLFLIF